MLRKRLQLFALSCLRFPTEQNGYTLRIAAERGEKLSSCNTDFTCLYGALCRLPQCLFRLYEFNPRAMLRAHVFPLHLTAEVL